MITVGIFTTWSPARNSPVYDQPVDFFGGQQVYAAIVDFSTRAPPFVTSPFHYDAISAINVALSNIVQRGAGLDAELKAAQAVVEFNMEG